MSESENKETKRVRKILQFYGKEYLETVQKTLEVNLQTIGQPADIRMRNFANKRINHFQIRTHN